MQPSRLALLGRFELVLILVLSTLLAVFAIPLWHFGISVTLAAISAWDVIRRDSTVRVEAERFLSDPRPAGLVRLGAFVRLLRMMNHKIARKALDFNALSDESELLDVLHRELHDLRPYQWNDRRTVLLEETKHAE